MLGLKPYDDEAIEYQQCIDIIESAVKNLTVEELEALNSDNGQAGVPALKFSEFLRTPHGEAIAKLPPFTVERLGPPPVRESAGERPSASGAQLGSGQKCLAGVRVLELCRVIAGPTIGRSLAAHGASVLKVTSKKLPDVPFFQLDVNTGKHTTSLDLKDEEDRATFQELLETVDVIIDGYRPGALKKLGYSPEKLAEDAAARGRGIVYVAEDCFGGIGANAPWASRPGWQQIADCVTGVAWTQGEFMGLEEPVVPPFPMSDYGTGILGTVAAMTGLYRREAEGGSWMCRTSLSQYDFFLMTQATYSPECQQRVKDIYMKHPSNFFGLKHHDSVDEVGRRALVAMKDLHPHLFADDMMQSAYSKAFDGVLKWPKEPLSVDGLKIAHVRTARPNGTDDPNWEGWEEDEALANA